MEYSQDKVNEAVAPVFYEIGLTLYACQELEAKVKYLAYITSKSGAYLLTEEEGLKLYESRITLGQLLKKLSTKIDFELTIKEGISDNFSKSLELRNRFVHSYIIEEQNAMFTEEGRISLCQKIKDIRRQIKSTCDDLSPTLAKLAKSIDNVDMKEVKESLKNEIKI